jgi:hypothetical protein
VISSSAVPNFAWTVATPLNGPSAGVTASQLAASADSFQNIFANAAALPQFAAASSLGSNMAANWTTQADTGAETASDDDAVSTLNPFQSSGPVSSSSAVMNSSSEPVEPSTESAPSSSPAPSGSQAAARNGQANTKQANTKADKKVEQHSQSLQAGTTAGSMSGVSGRAAPTLEAAASARAADHAMADHRSDVQQTERATDLTAKTVSVANAVPGSSNPLTGAAFALHITPAGNHSGTTQKAASSASAAAGLDQAAPTSAATANPADSALSDPAAVAGGFSDPAGLQVSAMLMANAGAGRSRQISALGSSLGSANTAPWSAQTSSPALLDDKAEPAESVAAAAPIAEVDMDDPTGTAQPVRTLQLQLGGTGDQRVELRLVEHAGGLSVSVRASDSSLTRGLQDNLPELSSRLAAEHYQTQTWLPAAGQTSTGGHSSGPFEQSPDQRGGRQSSQDGAASGGQGNSQQGREQDEPPAWWRQMAATDGASASASSVPGSLADSAASPISK